MQLIACLWFDGNARAAAEFYVSIFPDSNMGNSWIAPADAPSNEKGSEVVVDFTIFGSPFIGLNGGPSFVFSEAISFCLPCQDQTEIDHYWDLLGADGGQESRCGWLKDRFGVSWQVTSRRMECYLGGSGAEGARAATEAMLAMNKIVLDDLRAAYESAASK